MTGAELDIEVVVADLRKGSAAWAAAKLPERRDLLARVHAALAEHAQEWVDIAIRIKGLETSSPLVGREWISGPYTTLSVITALSECLEALEQGKSPIDGFPVRPAPGGRLAVQVLPHGIFDVLLLSGFRAEVWTRPGISESQLRSTAGLGERTPSEPGGVCAVLGAGNIFSIAPLDVLYELYAQIASSP